MKASSVFDPAMWGQTQQKCPMLSQSYYGILPVHDVGDFEIKLE
jgi:hypothetical protein